MSLLKKTSNLLFNSRMSLIEIIKNDIFAERFGGSLYTRFNQGQLEGLTYFLA